MCKIKEYSPLMQSYLNSVFLRFDNYLLEEDKNRTILTLREIFGGNPTESYLDEYLQHILDVDGIASTHDISITEVLRTTVLILRDITLEECKCEIFVHKFFIAFYFEKEGIDLNNLRNVLELKLKEIKMNIPIEDLCIRLFYLIANIHNEQLWSIIDKSAFPIIEGNSYNGRYTDSTSRDNISIDLTRTISPSEERGYSNIAIQTMAFASFDFINGSNEIIKTMIESSKEEITRCFSE